MQIVLIKIGCKLHKMIEMKWGKSMLYNILFLNR